MQRGKKKWRQSNVNGRRHYPKKNFYLTEEYLELCQSPMMVIFPQITDGF